MHELKRNSGHIDPEQAWHVKCVDGVEVYMKLGGGSNSFAHKHILAASKKDGVSDDTKMLRRIWHRVDHAGARTGNPDAGAKPRAAGVMTRDDKYGTTLITTTRSGNAKPATEVKNSVICLSLLDLDTVLVEMAQALRSCAATAHQVGVTFSRACVKTVNLAGGVSAATATMKIEFTRLVNGYEVTHLVP